MPEEIKEGTEETKEASNESKVSDGLEDVLLPDGRRARITAEERQYLINKGFAALEAERAKKEEPKEEAKEEAKDKEDDVDPKALNKKIDQALTLLAEQKKEREAEKENQRVSTIRNEIEKEIKECLDSHELTKDDKELAESARVLVINKMMTTRGMTAKQAFANEIKHFERLATAAKRKYGEEKKKDKENTRTSGKGGSAPDGTKKFSGADFLSGKMRKHINSKIKASMQA